MTWTPSPAVLAWGMGEPIAGTQFRQMRSPPQKTDGHLVLLGSRHGSWRLRRRACPRNEDQITVVVDGNLGATVGDRGNLLTGPGLVLLMPEPYRMPSGNAELLAAHRVLEI